MAEGGGRCWIEPHHGQVKNGLESGGNIYSMTLYLSMVDAIMHHVCRQVAMVKVDRTDRDSVGCEW